MDIVTTVVLFAELPELQLHLDPMLDSIYITAACRVSLYIFFRRDSTVLLFSPLFDLAAVFLAIPLYMAHPTAAPASPPQVVPFFSSESDPSEEAASSSSSSTPDDSYAPADPGMENGFLSSEPI